jgi:zinc/manganese transport system substrate-binding protein
VLGRLLLAILLTLGIAGCASVSSGAGDRPRVVASTTQLGDFARVVGGSAVDVHQILRPNTDPHEYEPRPSDVNATAGAKLVLASGSGLDAWMRKVLDEAGGKPRVLTIAPRGIRYRLDRDPTGGTTRATPRARSARSAAR